MDRDTIIRLAREAGAVFSADGSQHEFETQKTLERFAVLVAEHEREHMTNKAEMYLAMMDKPSKKRKVSEHSARVSIGMLRAQAQRIPINPFHLHVADQMEQLLNEVVEARKNK